MAVVLIRPVLRSCAAPAAAASTSTCVASGPNSTVVVPPRTTCSRSAIRSASGRSEVTTSTAVPLSASSVMIRWISSLAPTSTPWVGSASTSTSGRSHQLAGQHDLLRVATGHRADRLALVRRLHREPLDQVVGDRAFPGPVDEDAEAATAACRCPAEMLKAMDWKENIPSSLRLAGSRAMPSAGPPAGNAGAIALPVEQQSRRRWPGRSRRCRRRSRRRRSRPARTGRRSRPCRTATITSWNLPARHSPSSTRTGGPSGIGPGPAGRRTGFRRP